MKRITLSLQSPYVGLRPFGEREALLFFGRDQHTRELLTELEGKQRFIAVLGASGTGKSSLVRAGMVPALHRGALASAGYNWNVCIFKPGDAPLTNLAQALTEHSAWRDSEDRVDAIGSLSAALAMSPLALTELYRQKADVFADQALLLVVDQFEEIFRYRQRNVDEAESFINLLLRSASEEVPIYVVMTMRSDFLGHCVGFRGLPEAINRGLYLTPRLGPDQLKSIIASPLALVGGEIDPVLVNRLVNTLGGEDELPILEHALLRMWDRARAAERASIEDEDFKAVCSSYVGTTWAAGDGHFVSGQASLSFAIDRHASEIFDSLSSQQQRIARQVFLALVERREGRDVRRAQTLKQLVAEVGEQEREHLVAVIDAFRAEQVGFLLPQASEPLDDDKLIDIGHESLFRQWHLFRRWLNEEELDATELKEWQYRVARQKEGGGWLDGYDCQRAQRWRVRINQRTNSVVWTSRHGGPVTYREVDQYLDSSVERVKQAKAEQERLEREAKEAETKRLELEAQVQREAAERAEAERLQAEKEKQQARAYAESSRRKTRIALAVGAIAVLFFLFAAVAAWWANQERARADNERNRAEQAKARAEDALKVADEEKKRAEEEKAKAEIQTVEAERQRRLADDQKQAAIAGELVIKAENLTKQHPDQSALLALSAWRISPTAKAQGFLRVAVTDYLRQTVLRGHWDRVGSAQFAPDGKTVVTAGGSDKTARLWDVASGKELHILRGHADRVGSVQFAPDGKTVVTASDDGTARLWEAGSGKELHVLRGHAGGVRSVQFAPDGQTVVTASDDKTLRLWRCEVCRPVEELAAKLQKTIGRDLTDEERLRYGVPDEFFATK